MTIERPTLEQRKARLVVLPELRKVFEKEGRTAEERKAAIDDLIENVKTPPEWEGFITAVDAIHMLMGIVMKGVGVKEWKEQPLFASLISLLTYLLAEMENAYVLATDDESWEPPEIDMAEFEAKLDDALSEWVPPDDL